MNVEIGTETAQFPEKEYINGIFVAVRLIFQLSHVHIFNDDVTVYLPPISFMLHINNTYVCLNSKN